MNPLDATDLAVHRGLGERLATSGDPEVGRFVADALARSDRLIIDLVSARRRLADAESELAVSAAIQLALRALIDDQATRVEVLLDTVSRVRALCDLSAWSTSLALSDGRAAVFTDDLRKTLTDVE